MPVTLPRIINFSKELNRGIITCETERVAMIRTEDKGVGQTNRLLYLTRKEKALKTSRQMTK